MSLRLSVPSISSLLRKLKESKKDWLTSSSNANTNLFANQDATTWHRKFNRYKLLNHSLEGLHFDLQLRILTCGNQLLISPTITHFKSSCVIAKSQLSVSSKI